MIGILSDAHGNFAAFRVAIRQLEKLGARKIYFLGDAVGYIPSLEVVDDLMSLGDHVKCILGNHEQMLLLETGAQDREPVYQHRAVRAQLSAMQRDFLSCWPTQRREVIQDRPILFVHGSPEDVTCGYVYPDTVLETFDSQAAVVFMGHTHHPFISQSQDCLFVNVGSCGLPRDDGRFGSAAIYDPVCGTARIIRFDISVETQSVFDQYPMIHASVHKLLDRRRDSVIGEFV